MSSRRRRNSPFHCGTERWAVRRSPTKTWTALISALSTRPSGTSALAPDCGGSPLDRAAPNEEKRSTRSSGSDRHQREADRDYIVRISSNATMVVRSSRAARAPAMPHRSTKKAYAMPRVCSTRSAMLASMPSTAKESVFRRGLLRPRPRATRLSKAVELHPVISFELVLDEPCPPTTEVPVLWTRHGRSDWQRAHRPALLLYLKWSGKCLRLCPLLPGHCRRSISTYLRLARLPPQPNPVTEPERLLAIWQVYLTPLLTGFFAVVMYVLLVSARLRVGSFRSLSSRRRRQPISLSSCGLRNPGR